MEKSETLLKWIKVIKKSADKAEDTLPKEILNSDSLAAV